MAMAGLDVIEVELRNDGGDHLSPAGGLSAHMGV